jgi:cytochrome c-type biogenesis protein CcmH/NrfG
LQDALEIFKLNVYLYPGSANTYDSLGEAYAELGEVQLAINSYEKSLKLDPSNKNAEVQLSRLRSK